jgi:lysophospholipase L1-like esterase
MSLRQICLIVFIVGACSGIVVLRTITLAHRAYISQLSPHTLQRSSWSGGVLERQKIVRLSILKKPDVVMVGDSLTAFAPWQDLTNCGSLSNRGVPGAKARDLVADTALVAVKLHPKAAFILVGINDLLIGGSINDVLTAINNMVQSLMLAGSKVFIVSVFPVARNIGPAGLNGSILALNKSLSETATAGVQYINLHDKLADSEGYLKEDLTTDGIHLNAPGYEIWRDEILKDVQSNCSN